MELWSLVRLEGFCALGALSLGSVLGRLRVCSFAWSPYELFVRPPDSFLFLLISDIAMWSFAVSFELKGFFCIRFVVIEFVVLG